MTEQQVLTLMRRVVTTELGRRYRNHADLEDMVQEGCLKAWGEWQAGTARCSPVTVARICAHQAAGSWLRSRKARQQWRGVPVPQWLFFADLEPRDEPLVEQFEPAALERVAALALASQALAAMTERQEHLVRRTIMAGREYAQVAREEGQSVPSLWQAVQRGLARAREALQDAEP